ncbi:MAG TPA: IS3 family transposase [Rhabdochlamydiaceae bacterium]|jgi:transposase
MRAIDEEYLEHPYYGRRRMTVEMRERGFLVGQKRVRTAMQTMGLEAIYPKPNLSAANKDHKKFPYLLRGLNVDLRDIAQRLNRHEHTVRSWIKAYIASGITGLQNKHTPGHPKIKGPAVEQEIDIILFERMQFACEFRVLSRSAISSSIERVEWPIVKISLALVDMAILLSTA